MGTNTRDRESLFTALENRGWFWEGDFIYAPHRALWLHGNDPWGENLLDFHERFSARTQRIISMAEYHKDPEQHRQVVEDNQSLVSALEELLKDKGDIE